jgi:hypothetical protein
LALSKGEGDMKLKLILLALAILMVGKATVHTHKSHELCEGFLPPNDMKISAMFFDASQGGISHEDFDAVLDRIQMLYADEIKTHNAELVINRLWDDGTVNASAEQTNGKWMLNMYGGLARHQETTKDGFALVACHEMGHHLGGAPKYKNGWLPWSTSSWASNEGEADYYSTLKCLRRYFAVDNSSFVSENKWLSNSVDPLVDSRCNAMFDNTDERNFCVRGSYAGLATSRLLNSLGGRKVPPDFGTPDSTVVSKTNDNHPQAQCRLDTYFSGATCSVAVSENLSNRDYRPGSCYDANKTKYGLRPKCWFSTKKTFGSVGGTLNTVFY